MILMPVGHSRAGTRRYPHITLGIIVANILIFIITVVWDHQAEKKIMENAKTVLTYYNDNPCLNLHQEILSQLIMITDSKNEQYALLSAKARCAQLSNNEDQDGEDQEEKNMSDNPAQEHLNKLVSDLKASQKNFCF